MTADEAIRAALHQVEQFRDHHCNCTGDWVCPVHHALDALTAVLDMHAPFLWGQRQEALCSACEDREFNVAYPCPTVQAIATALGVDT